MDQLKLEEVTAFDDALSGEGNRSAVAISTQPTAPRRSTGTTVKLRSLESVEASFWLKFQDDNDGPLSDTPRGPWISFDDAFRGYWC